jgi:hypothetical protein
MSLLKLLQNFFFTTTHNPELDEATRRHYNLPETEYGKGIVLSKEEENRQMKLSEKMGNQLVTMLVASVQEHYSLSEQVQVLESIDRAIHYVAGRLFPDLDYENIWYTDDYDIIQLAKDMGFGDETLPHWPEETNYYNRYLEITASDLVQIFLGFSEEALLEDYKFGANVDKWMQYLLRETLKSRQRQAREKKKQQEALRFSPEKLKFLKNQNKI